MKTTDNFKKAIQKHLNYRGFQDPLFSETLKKSNKNIDECVNYILETVQKSGCAGFEDEEIYAMAVHYYDEDDIKASGKATPKVVVNHQVKISAEEIAEAKKKALDAVFEEEKARLKKPKAEKKDTHKKEETNTLFG